MIRFSITFTMLVLSSTLACAEDAPIPEPETELKSVNTQKASGTALGVPLPLALEKSAGLCRDCPSIAQINTIPRRWTPPNTSRSTINLNEEAPPPSLVRTPYGTATPGAHRRESPLAWQQQRHEVEVLLKYPKGQTQTVRAYAADLKIGDRILTTNLPVPN